MNRRRAGVLLPVFSLLRQGESFADAARAFIDWLAAAQFSVWQVLPIGPAGTDGSPYWLRSDHATDAALADPAIDPGGVSRAEFAAWCERERDWLPDYALYAVLAAERQGAAWQDWPPSLRDRDAATLAAARRQHAAAIERVAFEQFLAARSWAALRAYANGRGVAFGDLPIYVAPVPSRPVHRGQFQPTAGRPIALAGVPPDYFAADGQLWGNPLYDWEAMAAVGYAFWRSRVRRALARFDLLRLDHFRGLAACWRVPAGAATAREGDWRPAGGAALLRALIDDARSQLGPDVQPFVAEDLGIITPDVEALRCEFALPGMRVLQFAFDGSPDNPYLPHRHTRDSVVYTGTHDNDTTLGWYRGLDAATREFVAYVLRARPDDMPGALVHAALASVADSRGSGRGPARPRQRGAHQCARHGAGQLALAAARGRPDHALAQQCARANRVFGRALLR